MKLINVTCFGIKHYPHGQFVRPLAVTSFNPVHMQQFDLKSTDLQYLKTKGSAWFIPVPGRTDNE